MAGPDAHLDRPFPGGRVVDRGPGASAALAAGRGRILAILDSCVYLCAEAGEVACLGPRGLGNGPLQLAYVSPAAIAWKRTGIRGADAWRYDGASLTVAGRLHFDARGSHPWSPATPTGVFEPAAFGERLSRLSEGCIPAVGLGYLIPILAAIPAGAAEGRLLWPRGLATRSADPVAALAEAVIGRVFESLPIDEGRLSEAAVGLLGLGPGLTPSGDDLVGGLLLALRHLRMRALADALGARVVSASAWRTNVISAAHLRWAARGLGGEALHGILAALHRADHRVLADRLSALSRVGHCSGWDMLAGVMLGWAIWAMGSWYR